MSPPGGGARRRMSSGGWAGRRSRRGEPRARVVAWHAALVVISALLLLPLASMIIGSLRLPGLPPPRGIEWLPRPLAWGNYGQVFQVVDLGRYALNTMVIEAMSVPVTLLVASWAGFALSQLRNRLSQAIIA